LIATTRGHVPIDAIRIGDTVLTHRTRWRPVTGVMQRMTEALVEIRAFGHQLPVTCTPTHPFLVYRKATQQRQWVTADALQPGDCLVTPRLTANEAPIISEALARVIAWFICEGSVTGNSVEFALNPKDEHEQAEVQGLLKVLGYVSTWNGSSLTVCSVALADRLVAWCGSGAAQKRIPFDVIVGHESVVFEELIRGDGCVVTPVQGGHRYAFTTVSHGLALDVQLLAAALGRRAGIVVRPERDGVIEGRRVHQRPSYLVQIPLGRHVNHAKDRDAFPTRYGVAYRVRSVTPLAVPPTPVFNLAVKGDESYVAMGRAVHNCSFEAAIRGAYYATELNAARTSTRIRTIPWEPEVPVETWWDIGFSDATAIIFTQTIGREVRLIDYLEASGQALPAYVKALRDRPYLYRRHHLPHDAEQTELGSGRSIADQLRALGVRSLTVGRSQDVLEGIQQARTFLARCWFDEQKCARLLDCLANYRSQWDEKRQDYKPQPYHDQWSHGADAFRYLAMDHHLRPADAPRPTVYASFDAIEYAHSEATRRPARPVRVISDWGSER
jgi:hypothetical protein